MRMDCKAICVNTMTVSKPVFFALLFIILVSPFWAVKAFWLMHSKKALGVMEFAGRGLAGEQIQEDYSVIHFSVGGDTIRFNGLGNLFYKPGTPVPVRYQADNVYDARVDIFAGIWGDTLVYSGIPALMLLALFVHARVVPWGSRVRIRGRRPFVTIVPSSKKIGHG
ncbi:MAG: hypothetical protein JST68_00960 [Bacteroidetes bacterium]|nr:hypothetical protein [Bacteroidota bacterium]